MPIPSPYVQPKDVVILQRSDNNAFYGEAHISGSKLLFHIDATGHINADDSASFYTLYPPPGGLTPGGTYQITASWASQSFVAITASWASQSFSAVSASWASRSLSASYADFTFSSSYAISSSHADSASYEILYEDSSSYAETSSWALRAITASNADTSSWALRAISASWSTPHSASETPMLWLNDSKFWNVQHLQDVFHSAGWVSGGLIATGSVSGSYTVSAGNGLIRGINDTTASIYWFSWNSASFTASNIPNQEFHVYVNYNGGNPIVTTSSIDPSLTDYQTNLTLGHMYYVSSSLRQEFHINPVVRETVGDHAKLMIQFNKAIMPYAREEGGILSGSALTINITAGAFWEGLNRFTTNAFDSTGSGRFSLYHRSASVWSEMEDSQSLDNDNYNDVNTGLVAMLPNRYKVDYVFLGVDSDVHVIYGTGQYTSLANAQASSVPAVLPPEVLTDSFLIGRAIIQEGNNSVVSFESVFTLTFTSTLPSDHNSLSGLQGGTAGQYYHLTSAEYTGTGTGIFVRQTNAVVSGSFTGSFSGSLWGTSSWADTASWALSASQTNTASWAVSSSHANQSDTSSWAITSSWSSQSLSASYTDTASWAVNAINGGTQLQTASTYPITSSWAESASWTPGAGSSDSASWASSSIWAQASVTADFALDSMFAWTASNAETSSWSVQSLYALSSDFALVAGWAFTGSYAETASWAINAINGGTQLSTASTYPITSSWAETSSWAINSGTTLTTSSYYPISASWADTASTAVRTMTADFAVLAGWAYSSSWAASASVTIAYVTSASYAETASWAINAINGGTQLVTASLYPITASWSVSASWAPTSSAPIGPGTPAYFPTWASGSGLTITSSIYQSGSSIGIKTTTPTYDLQVNGTFGAVAKSFIIDHPTKPGKKLSYGSLESPYHGIRLTGRGRATKKGVKIELPDYICKLVTEENVNIQLTPIRCHKVFYVDRIDIENNCFYVKFGGKGHQKSYGFFWDFTAVRNDVPQLVTEI